MNAASLPCSSSKDRLPAKGEKEAIEDMVQESQKAIRLAGLAVMTEKTYISWIVRFSKFRLRRLQQSLWEFNPKSLSLYLE
ncbi:MAG: hypothetical protein QM496_18320 [Verrucomicrobiota bacterium]